MLSIPCYAIVETSDSELENKTETEKRIDELNGIIEISYDEMEGKTWYNHKKEMGYYGIQLYLGKTEDDIKFMRLSFATKGSDWIFLNKIIFLADGKRFVFNIDPLERKSDVYSDTYSVTCSESADILIMDSFSPLPKKMTERDLSMLRDECAENKKPLLSDIEKIVNSKEVKIRFSGSESYREIELKEKFIGILLDVVDYYNLVLLKPSK